MTYLYNIYICFCGLKMVEVHVPSTTYPPTLPQLNSNSGPPPPLFLALPAYLKRFNIYLFWTYKCKWFRHFFRIEKKLERQQFQILKTILLLAFESYFCLYALYIFFVNFELAQNFFFENFYVVYLQRTFKYPTVLTKMDLRNLSVCNRNCM